VRNVVLLRVEQGRLLFFGHLPLISEPLGRAILPILYLHACAAVNAMLRPAETCPHLVEQVGKRVVHGARRYAYAWERGVDSSRGTTYLGVGRLHS
jgi:hypothetical protein